MKIKKTAPFFPNVCLLALMSASVSSCSKESAVKMFADVDCIYYGTLAVNRDVREDMQLATYHTDGVPTEETMFPKTIWGQNEQEKEVPIGGHLVLYYPKDNVTLDERKLEMSLPGNILADKPLLYDHKKVKVPYNDRVTTDMVFGSRGTAFKIDLTNSSTLDLTKVDISSSSAYLGYSVMTAKPINEGSFKHEKEPFDLESLGHREMLGYTFGVSEAKPIDMVMTFADENGIEYVLADDLKGIYKKDEKVSNLYVATIDITDDYLINLGAKKIVTAVEIDGKDINFPPAGGKMTMDVQAVSRTKTYQYGKVIDSVDGETVPWTYEVKGDDAFTVTRLDDGTLQIEAPINNTPNERSIEIIVTATGKGVTRTFRVTQKAYGYEIEGNVE